MTAGTSEDAYLAHQIASALRSKGTLDVSVLVLLRVTPIEDCGRAMAPVRYVKLVRVHLGLI
jgi:hypothetical protein